ncbi:MAG: nucleotidyltransferase family protein [Anaerolineales bacterium]
MTDTVHVTAIILAAGESRRMGQPKIAMPWGNTTVLGHIIKTLEEGGVALGLDEIIVVSGRAHTEILKILQTAQAKLPLHPCFNPHYQQDEMLISLQVGMSCLSPHCQAVLVALGDNPQILPSTVHLLLKEYLKEPKPILMPSYQMRRGHPWMIDRSLFSTIKDLQPPLTMRDFFQKHADQIHYVLVDTPTILQDIDTPQDYERYHPHD